MIVGTYNYMLTIMLLQENGIIIVCLQNNLVINCNDNLNSLLMDAALFTTFGNQAAL